MKKLLALLAAVVLGTQSLYASDFLFMKNIKFYGEGQTIGYVVQNGYDVNVARIAKGTSKNDVAGMLNTNYNGVATFLTAGITFDIVKNISADFSLAYSNNWADGGNQIFSLANNPSGSATKGDSIQSYLDNIRVQTANVTIKNLFDVDGFSVKVGRQYYGDEDSSVMYFGVRHYQPLFGLNLPFIGFDNMTSVNAVTFNYDKEKIKANIVYANLGRILGVPLGADAAILGSIAKGIDEYINLDKDTIIIGADVKLLKLADFFNLQLYGYDVETPVLVDHYSIAGVKPGIEVGGLKLSVEYATNFAGKNPFSSGYIFKIDEDKEQGVKNGGNLIKADISYDIEKKAKVRASYAMQGGTEGLKELLDGQASEKIIIKPFINFGNYVPGMVFGQQNITRILSMVDFKAINVGVDYFVNKFTFSVDYYNLTSRDNGLNYGDEVDLKVKYQYIKGLDFFFGVGCFMASDDINSKIKTITGGDVENFLSDMTSTFQLGASYKF